MELIENWNEIYSIFKKAGAFPKIGVNDEDLQIDFYYNNNDSPTIVYINLINRNSKIIGRTDKKFKYWKPTNVRVNHVVLALSMIKKKRAFILSELYSYLKNEINGLQKKVREKNQIKKEIFDEIGPEIISDEIKS